MMDGLIFALTVQNKYEQLRSRGLGHGASTLDEASWYGRSESRWNIMPQLGG